MRIYGSFVAVAVLVGGALAAGAPVASGQVLQPPRDASPQVIENIQVPLLPGGGTTRAPLPALAPDAQRLVDQWKQELAGLIEQLRFLQQAYRDSGRAEEAAVIAAQVRVLTQASTLRPGGPLSADLVNEGLPPSDPPQMSLFRGRPGETFSFAIRGRDDQPVWGTTTYTDDSALETAAVHAGLLRPGQTGIVKVRPLPGQPKYEASAQHGVQSSAFERHAGSYQFVSASTITPPRTTSMQSYRDLVGQSITIPVVGSTGQVWGTDVYTDDSSVAAAAVHAGVLAPGEFGFVKVTFMAGQERYEASVRNGITSQPFEAWQGSFRVEHAGDATVQLPGGEDASRLVNMEVLRNRPGTTFSVQVVGTSVGPVWGTDTYTDDSLIAAAAVHAGLLKPGEVGTVRVTIVAGRDSYAASERNGVKSNAYGKWDGSFRIARAR